MHWTGYTQPGSRDEERSQALAEALPRAVPLVDRRRFENITFGEPSFRAELLEMFFAETKLQIAALTDAISSGSPDLAGRAAHSLKGAAANVGAVQMSELAGKLEVIVRSGGLEFATPLLKDLQALDEETRAAMEAA